MSDEKKQDLTVKPATTLEEQVNILKSRGLEIDIVKGAVKTVPFAYLLSARTFIAQAP